MCFAGLLAYRVCQQQPGHHSLKHIRVRKDVIVPGIDAQVLATTRNATRVHTPPAHQQLAAISVGGSWRKRRDSS